MDGQCAVRIHSNCGEIARGRADCEGTSRALCPRAPGRHRTDAVNRIWLRSTLIASSLLWADLPVRTGRAADFHAGFDEGHTSWFARMNRDRVRLAAHRRIAEHALRGSGAEEFDLHSAAEGESVLLEYPLPPARVLTDELQAALWVRCDRPGAQLGLRVVFPHQKDPRTGEWLTILLRGEVYTTPGRWQELRCRTPAKEFGDRVKLLRYQFKDTPLDLSGMYADRLVVGVPLAPGNTRIQLDELTFGPVVSPEPQEHVAPQSDDEVRGGPPVEFRLDRLYVEGRPFFPRMAAYHGEDLSLWSAASLNVAWLPNVEDRELLSRLRQQGLWAAATPPRAVSATGQILPAADAGLMPFSAATAPILFWNFGTRIPAAARPELLTWHEQVQTADRRYRRPTMADVTGDERLYSRHFPMLGVGRHVLNTSLGPAQYRDGLLQSRKLARPGSFAWTWIQTEPASALAAQRRAGAHSPIVIEPEQIRWQVYAALSAGCRGLGYWKTTRLDADGPGARERLLQIGLLNVELALLEPWLSTGTVVDHVPIQLGAPASAGASAGRLRFRAAAVDRNAPGSNNAAAPGTPDPEFSAAVIRGELGTLLLPVWYERGAQFVPGQLVAAGAVITVRGVEESASAWEVTTTGIRSLRPEPVAGGMRVALEKLDQTAAVILSSDRTLRQQLFEKIQKVAPESARRHLELAEAKAQRVRAVDEELGMLGVSQADAPQLLDRAERFLEAARSALKREEFDQCRQAAADAMQALRLLQRAHWNDAVARFSSPLSSPHTLCFQTLPDHWKLVARLGRSRGETEANSLLRSGDFEDIDTMLVEGWRHHQHRLADVRAAAELLADPHGGKYCLRLVACPAAGVDPPTVVEHSPVSVSSPPITVHAGQIVHISGWVRVAAPSIGSLDGAMIYDNLTGPVGALRWQERTGWLPFQLIREIHQSGPLMLTLTLDGLGEMHVDDLRVLAIGPDGSVPQPGFPIQQTGGERPPSRPWDLLGRLPRWNPLRGPRE